MRTAVCGTATPILGGPAHRPGIPAWSTPRPTGAVGSLVRQLAANTGMQSASASVRVCLSSIRPDVGIRACPISSGQVRRLGGGRVAFFGVGDMGRGWRQPRTASETAVPTSWASGLLGAFSGSCGLSAIRIGALAWVGFCRAGRGRAAGDRYGDGERRWRHLADDQGAGDVLNLLAAIGKLTGPSAPPHPERVIRWGFCRARIRDRQGPGSGLPPPDAISRVGGRWVGGR